MKKRKRKRNGMGLVEPTRELTALAVMKLKNGK
jgi:hypothetical protein